MTNVELSLAERLNDVPTAISGGQQGLYDDSHLEQRVFHAAAIGGKSKWTRVSLNALIRDLWSAYCWQEARAELAAARIEALEKALAGPARYADAYKHVCRDEEFVLVPAAHCENARDVLALSTLSPARVGEGERAAELETALRRIDQFLVAGMDRAETTLERKGFMNDALKIARAALKGPSHG